MKHPRGDGSYAFKWITLTNSQGDPVGYEAVIPEGDLKSALADELQDFPVHFNPGEIVFESDFNGLVFTWDRLESIAMGSKPAVPMQTQQDLKALLNLIREVETLKGYFDYRSLDLRSGAIAYEYLWTAFKPGTVIYAYPMDCPQAFLVHDYVYLNEKSCFLVLCWSYGKECEFARI